MAPIFVLHKVSVAIGTTTKDYFFLANPATYVDATVGTACGIAEANNAEKAVEVPVSVGALVASAYVVGLTVYGKDATAKRHVHKVLCAADKEQAFRLKVGSSYTYTKPNGSASVIEITKIMRSRKADFI